MDSSTVTAIATSITATVAVLAALIEVRKFYSRHGSPNISIEAAHRTAIDPRIPGEITVRELSVRLLNSREQWRIFRITMLWDRGWLARPEYSDKAISGRPVLNPLQVRWTSSVGIAPPETSVSLMVHPKATDSFRVQVYSELIDDPTVKRMVILKCDVPRVTS